MTEQAKPTQGPYDIWGEDEQVSGVPCIEIGRGKIPSPEAKSLCLIQSTLDQATDKFVLTEEDWANARLFAQAPETAAERDRLLAELSHIDGILARRPALDDESDRASKILLAIHTASQRDRLKAVNAELVTALEGAAISLALLIKEVPDPGTGALADLHNVRAALTKHEACAKAESDDLWRT